MIENRKKKKRKKIQSRRDPPGYRRVLYPPHRNRIKYSFSPHHGQTGNRGPGTAGTAHCIIAHEECRKD